MTDLPRDDETRFELGCDAYNRGEWDRAFALFTPLAVMGDPRAQHWLSGQYRLGLGAPHDPAQAWSLILAAARTGYKPARQHMAGECIAMMGGFTSPPAEYRESALQWLRDDADAGDPDAQTHVGFACLYGFPPFEQDASDALAWFLKAATQDHAPAQFELGALYALSASRRDLEQSLDWYGKAAKQGHVRAQVQLAHLYENGGHGVRKDQAVARDWYGKAAQNGDLGAARTLVRIYERGLGVAVDREQAFVWRVQSALLGDSSSAFVIGKAFASGRGVAARDDLQAFVWLSLAALTDEQTNHRRLAQTASARDKVAARLSASQLEEARSLIDDLKVRFIGDGERWTRKSAAAPKET